MTNEEAEKKIKKLANKIKDTYAFKASFDVEETIRSSVFEKLKISISDMSSITFRIFENHMNLAIITTVISNGRIVQHFIFKFSFLKGSDSYGENQSIYC